MLNIMHVIGNSEVTNKALGITKYLFFDYQNWFEQIAYDTIMAQLLFESGLFDISKYMINSVFVKIFSKIIEIWEFDGRIDGYFEIVEAIFDYNAIITIKTHEDDADIPCGQLNINVKADTTGVHNLEVSNDGYEFEDLDISADGQTCEPLQVQGQTFLSNYKNYIGAIETYTPTGIHLVYSFSEAYSGIKINGLKQ
jgi:hypothetical protein